MLFKIHGFSGCSMRSYTKRARDLALFNIKDGEGAFNPFYKTRPMYLSQVYVLKQFIFKLTSYY